MMQQLLLAALPRLLLPTMAPDHPQTYNSSEWKVDAPVVGNDQMASVTAVPGAAECCCSCAGTFWSGETDRPQEKQCISGCEAPDPTPPELDPCPPGLPRPPPALVYKSDDGSSSVAAAPPVCCNASAFRENVIIGGESGMGAVVKTRTTVACCQRCQSNAACDCCECDATHISTSSTG
eukprot:COSAG01_NODE_9041_length_2572_cov_4.925192_2_plen_179_part_00